MKQVPTKLTGDQYSAEEFNALPSQELQNVVLSTSQTLNESDLYQLGKSMAHYASRGNFYIDTGTTSTYVLSPQTPMRGLSAYINGSKVSFMPANTNIGAAQINVNGLGLKDLKDMYGNPLQERTIVAGRLVDGCYNGTYWFLIDHSVVEPQVFNSIQADYVDATDVTLTRGTCTDISAHFRLVLPANITKDISAVWAAGDGNGGRASGVALANDTWYHYFLIGKNDGTVDAGFDTNVLATNLLADATGYIWLRRITSVKTQVSSTDLEPFVSLGNRYGFTTAQPIVNLVDLNAGFTNYNALTPPDVVVIGIFNITAGTISTDSYLQQDSFFYGYNGDLDLIRITSGTEAAIILTSVIDDNTIVLRYAGGGPFNAGSVFPAGWEEIRN